MFSNNLLVVSLVGKMRVHIVLLTILPLGYGLAINETCSAEDAQICGRCTNVGCADQKYNLIGSFTSVSSKYECHDWCNRRNAYMGDCKYLTYYGKGGLPYENICYIFSSCEKKIEGTDCVTEATDCYHVPTSMATTPTTTKLTTATTTLKTTTLPTPSTTTTTTSTTPKTTTSTSTTTTTVTTSTTTPKPCTMYINGKLVQHHKFEYSGNEETFGISGNLGCHLRVLAVGGGGQRGYDTKAGRNLVGTGAGSGYITNSDIKFPCESFEISLTVGGPGQVSVIKTKDGRVINANPGGDSTNLPGSTNIGGNGFSGGEKTEHFYNSHIEKKGHNQHIVFSAE